MNYMSNCNDCHESYDCIKKPYDHIKKPYKKDECKTIIKCGGISTPVTLPIAIAVGTSFPIVHLSIDSTGLCNPSSIIEFETNISYLAAITAGAITFQIFKSSKCNPTAEPIAISPAWAYTALPGILTSENIKFFVCDSGDCADYTVVVTVTTVLAGAAVTLSNSNLKAITTCGPNACCYCCK